MAWGKVGFNYNKHILLPMLVYLIDVGFGY